MADHDHAARIVREMVGQHSVPRDRDHCRLVEQQQVGLGESTAASATRMRQPPEKSLHGRRCASSLKPEAGENLAARAGAACAPCRKSRPGSRQCDADRRGLGLVSRWVRSDVGGEHDFDQAFPDRPAFLRERRCGPRAGRSNEPCSSASSPVMARNSVVLPCPLRPTSPNARRAGMRAAASSEQAARDAESKYR